MLEALKVMIVSVDPAAVHPRALKEIEEAHSQVTDVTGATELVIGKQTLHFVGAEGLKRKKRWLGFRSYFDLAHSWRRKRKF